MTNIVFDLVGMLFLLVVGGVMIAGAVFAGIWTLDSSNIVRLPRKEGVIDWHGMKWGQSRDKFLGMMSSIGNSLLFRFAMVAALTMLMMIPLGMVRDVVKERSQLQQGVIQEISQAWGKPQNIQGPALVIPYTEKIGGKPKSRNKADYRRRMAVLLPDKLNMQVGLEGQTRQRGLYKAEVYTADLKVTGQFQRPDLKSLSDKLYKVHWNEAWLSFGITDTRALNTISALSWSKKSKGEKDKKGKEKQTEADKVQLVEFGAGTRIPDTFKNGFHARLDLTQPKSKKRKRSRRRGRGRKSGKKAKKKAVIYPFSLTLNVKGSKGLTFSPVGKTTEVTLKSDWPHPSFRGQVLPAKRSISKKGFEAYWSISHLARNYPQLWTQEARNFDIGSIATFCAGVDLFESVSHYSQVIRAIKYGVLFMGLTFMTFLIFELGIGRKLHVVQYGMIGLALSMFYLVLLSMSEHGSFFNAYISAAGIIIVMISLYAYAAIRKIGRALLISMMLSGLYASLYTLLQLEDLALVSGTVLLLVILAVMMFLTRNIGHDADDTNPLEEKGTSYAG